MVNSMAPIQNTSISAPNVTSFSTNYLNRIPLAWLMTAVPGDGEVLSSGRCKSNASVGSQRKINDMAQQWDIDIS
jgi:hypothetical protein